MRPLIPAATLALVLAAACQPEGGGGGGRTGPGQPSSGPPREFTGEPSSMPPGASADGATLVEELDFATAAVPFVDGVSPEGMASGSFHTGRWTSGAGVYAQEEPGASTKLAIRRYTGALGSRYRVEVTGWIYREFTSDPARDASVFSVLPYYRDETHYVICSTGANLAEAWICSGQLPGTTWPVSNKLWGMNLSPARTPGIATTWSCDVDTVAGSLTIYLDGDRKAAVTSPFITGTGGVALAANGSQVKFARFRIYRLAGAVAPTPRPSVAPTLAPRATPAPTARPRVPTPDPEE